MSIPSASSSKRLGAVLRELLVMLGPSAAMGLAGLLAAPGPEGRFQSALAGLVGVTLVGAFGAGDRLFRALFRLAGAAAGGGLVVALGGGDGPAACWLLFGVGAAASGLATLGRRLGTPFVSAGSVATGVLLVAMSGLFWADPTSALLPRAERRPWRQAVLHVDPALALAHDPIGFDRLRSPEVYFTVPLASGLYETPRALPTGAIWLGTGCLAWGGVLLASRRRKKCGGRRRSPTVRDREEGGRERGRGDTSRPPRQEA